MNINPIPYGVLALILFVVGGLWAYHKGGLDCRNEYQAKHAESLTRAIEQANEQAAIDAEILQAASERKATHEIRTKILTKTVTRHVASTPVFTNCTLDPCGLCLANAAANATDSSGCPCGVNASMSATEAHLNATMGALLESYIETANRLHSCRDTHSALVDWVKAEDKNE